MVAEKRVKSNLFLQFPEKIEFLANVQGDMQLGPIYEVIDFFLS